MLPLSFATLGAVLELKGQSFPSSILFDNGGDVHGVGCTTASNCSLDERIKRLEDQLSTIQFVPVNVVDELAQIHSSCTVTGTMR
jgi:hypothetical protein